MPPDPGNVDLTTMSAKPTYNDLDTARTQIRPGDFNEQGTVPVRADENARQLEGGAESNRRANFLELARAFKTARGKLPDVPGTAGLAANAQTTVTTAPAQLNESIPVFLTDELAPEAPASLRHKTGDSKKEDNRKTFDQWLLHAGDVFDSRSLEADLEKKENALYTGAWLNMHRPIKDAISGKGSYLAALQFYYASSKDPAANNIMGFSRSIGVPRAVIAKWITSDRVWNIGLPAAHHKVAEQLAAKRPELLPGFAPVIVFPNLTASKSKGSTLSSSDRLIFDKAVAQADDVFDVKRVMEVVGKSTPRELHSSFLRMHKPIAEALTGQGLYLAAMRYRNLSSEQKAQVSYKRFCEDQCVKRKSMDRWISVAGDWNIGFEAAHNNVMAQLTARRPDLLALSKEVVASAAQTNHHRPEAIVDMSRENVAEQATQTSLPHLPKPIPDSQALPSPRLVINESPDDMYVDISAPPIISLDPASDDSSLGLVIDTAPSSIAASPVQSPEIIETEAQPSYFRPWIKPEPSTSPNPAPESPITAEAPVKEEVPIPRHRIDNTVPILQGENGEDILLDALQPSQRNRRTSNVQELLDRMKLTFGDDTKEAMAKRAAVTGGSNIRATIKHIKDDVGERARWLATLSGEERARYMESWMEVEEVPGMGRGVKAARDIPPFTVLAPYAGKLLSGDAINAEWEKLGMNFTNYTFGTKSDNTLISAFGDGIGNISSLVNKGDDPAQNNLTVMMLGGKLVYLMNDRPISAGEALLYDYGEAYDYRGWPKHPILVQDSEPSDASGTESEIE